MKYISNICPKFPSLFLVTLIVTQFSTYDIKKTDFGFLE